LEKLANKFEMLDLTHESHKMKRERVNYDTLSVCGMNNFKKRRSNDVSSDDLAMLNKRIAADAIDQRRAAALEMEFLHTDLACLV
jgi:hypothetical protein